MNRAGGETAASQRPRGGTVYVVDDDATVRRSTAFLLNAYQFDCRSFADGDALLDEIPHLDPGCILLDMCLPGSSGLDVQAELRRRGSTLPVIVMTGDSEAQWAGKSRAMGAIEFLEKPFAEEALIAALELAFEHLARPQF